MEDAFEGFEDDDTTRRQSRRECRWPASSGKGFCKMIIGGNAPHCPRHTCEARGCSAGKPSSKPFCPIHDSTTTLGTTITQTRRELPLPPIPAEHGALSSHSKSLSNRFDPSINHVARSIGNCEVAVVTKADRCSYVALL